MLAVELRSQTLGRIAGHFRSFRYEPFYTVTRISSAIACCVERWTRTSPTELAYKLTIEDPTVWVRPWTVKREFTRQSDEENKIYCEPHCIEGNYALPGMLRGARMEETAFAEGRGPNPATKDKTIGVSGVAEDPLEIPR